MAYQISCVPIKPGDKPPYTQGSDGQFIGREGDAW